MDDEMEFETEIQEPLVPKAASRAPSARALIVSDDTTLTRICVRQLQAYGIRADVVWTRAEALTVLSRREDPLAFAFVDARLFGATWAATVDEIRALRPAAPFVVASSEIGDLLAGDGVAICTPFSPEEFQAAFEASLFDLEIRQTLLEAAATVRAIDAAEAAALAAGLSPLPISA